MSPARFRFPVLVVVGLAALVLATDAIGGRGSLKYGRKCRMPGRLWVGGDTYAGESRKSSADRKPRAKVDRSLQDRTVPALPRSAVGTELGELPPGSMKVNAAGRLYYYHSGVFYKRVLSSGEVEYQVTEPPYGAVVEALPADFQKVEEGSSTYYLVDGTCYRRILRDGEVAYIVTRKP